MTPLDANKQSKKRIYVSIEQMWMSMATGCYYYWDGFSIWRSFSRRRLFLFYFFSLSTTFSHSTDPMAEDEKKDDQQQRVSRHKLSVTQKTQQQLEKMFSRIDKPVHIPEPPKEKSVKAPKDFVRNVPGKVPLWKGKVVVVVSDHVQV